MYTAGTPRVLRRAAAVIGVLTLMACGAPLSTPPKGADPALLRNPTVPLAGSLRFAPRRFAGTWQTVGCIGTCDVTVSYEAGPDGILLRRAADRQRGYAVVGPGVFRSVEGKDRIVVMWIDEGFRTAAVGDAEGRWAAILDRHRPAAADRFTAAREVLDFNGWDVTRLTEVSG